MEEEGLAEGDSSVYDAWRDQLFFHGRELIGTASVSKDNGQRRARGSRSTFTFFTLLFRELRVFVQPTEVLITITQLHKMLFPKTII